MKINKKIPFHIQLSYLFTSILLVFGVTLGVVQFEKMSQILLVEVSSQYQLIGQKAVNNVVALYDRAKVQTMLLAHHDIIDAKNLQQRLTYLPYLSAAINSSDSTIAAYIAYPNGDYFMLRQWTDTDYLRKKYQPPESTVWLVKSIENSKHRMLAQDIFLDEQLHEIARRPSVDPGYDARQKSWYVSALQHPMDEVVASDPYYLHTDGMLGFSYTTRAQEKAESAVVGVDIEMSELTELLAHRQGTPSSRIALLTQQSEVLAMQIGQGEPYMPEPEMGLEGKIHLPKLNSNEAPVLFKLFESNAIDNLDSHKMMHLGDAWETYNAEIPIPNGNPLRLIIASPHSELLVNVQKMRQQMVVIFIAVVVAGILLTMFFSRFASKSLKLLAKEAATISHFEFDDAIHVHSSISEVDELARSMVHMKTTIRSFLELSVSLASESNIDQLLKRVLNELSSVVGSERGVLYLYRAQQKILEATHFKARNKLTDRAENFPTISLEDSQNPLVEACTSSAKVVSMQPEQCVQWFGQALEFHQEKNLIAIPLKDRNNNLVGAIALLMKAGEIDLGRKKMAEAISGAAAVAIENQLLIHEQKTLLEAFIQLIAGAIDAKSPYTGGHCQRVPVLAKMLADAACQQQSGVFADFNLSPNDWEQLHIAAWLHDCGKVTTPEYVVDKATKLETLYDRLHEIRMRFEVLKRDAKIAYWEGVAKGGDQTTLEQELVRSYNQIDADFAFVASCNEGGEFLDQQKIERLKQIAQQTWQRTLSDRIGLSHDEKLRKQKNPEVTLPATESVLADKPEHRIERSPRDQLSDDNPWGFKVDVPEYLYQRGELYNLSISRGTLTAEERYKINEHMIQTIIMLDKLPFPRHLSQVPEIAGGHHEKMDGTGYPKRLTQDQMSIPARLMAIADIFEALTAADRPYKEGKKLSEAIQIMFMMKKAAHIDADLFALFLTSGVYLDYAKHFLRPDQIDAVDINRYL